MPVTQVLKKIVFGDTLLPQELTIGLRGPQTEIAVWLHGMGAARDVTHRHTTACSAPFVLCVAFDEMPSEREMGRLSLRYCERNTGRMLGEIGLRRAVGIEPVAPGLVFFEVRSSANHCMPAVRLGMHYLLHAWMRRGKAKPAGMEMSFLERRAAMVSFIRPHPTSIGSIADEHGGNIFIMNLMGELGDGRFAFGLKDSRRPAHLVERTGRIAVSSVPFERGETAFQLAAHHLRESVEWERLDFRTRRSAVFGIPVPEFALRVREMELEAVRRIGSHTFFVAILVGEEGVAEGEELHAVHGFYQAWRLRGRGAELRESVAADAVNKRGLLRR